MGIETKFDYHQASRRRTKQNDLVTSDHSQPSGDRDQPGLLAKFVFTALEVGVMLDEQRLTVFPRLSGLGDRGAR
jgi:hypothetical protein